MLVAKYVTGVTGITTKAGISKIEKREIEHEKTGFRLLPKMLSFTPSEWKEMFPTCDCTLRFFSGQLAASLSEDDSLIHLDYLFIQHLRNSHLLYTQLRQQE